MKKLIISLVAILMLSGCAHLNQEAEVRLFDGVYVGGGTVLSVRW